MPSDTPVIMTPEEERRVLCLTVIVAFSLLVLLAAITYVIWPRYPECPPQREAELKAGLRPDLEQLKAELISEFGLRPKPESKECDPRRAGRLVWDPEKGIKVMWVPIYILEWALAGAMVSVLYRLTLRRDLPVGRLALYTWAIAKPVIGVFMGALVYFIALAAAKLLDGAAEYALWLNVVAFVGGFSDELSVGLIHRFVRRRLGDDAGDEGGPKPDVNRSS